MRVTFLGTGDAWVDGGAGNSALLLEASHGRLLVDCGPTVPRELAARHLGIDDLDAALITHAHGDHSGGLPFLLFGAWCNKKREPLLVVGPPRIEEQTSALFSALYPGMRVQPRLPVRFQTVLAGESTSVSGWSVTALATAHMTLPWLGLAYRITGDGKTVAVSGDTGAGMDLASLARGVDLFVCECTNVEPAGSEHMDVATITALRPTWSARRVVLTHLTTAVRERADAVPGVEIANDGLTIAL
jgi:ribonuclease BN (tRNA processing enzyme)